MLTKPIISVIVPCYNQAQYLKESLESVLKQTYDNWECIIVNDGSSDNTEELSLVWTLKDKRFKYLYKVNGGLSSARNAGIRVSVGQFILPLDADDKIHKTYLQKICEAFQKNPYLELVSSKIQFFGALNNELVLPKYSFTKQLVQNCFVCTSSFKKKSWERINGYDEQMTSFEDWEFWIRLLNEKSKVYKIPETMFFYRKHAQGSLSNVFKKDVEFYYSLYDYVYEKHLPLYKKYFPRPILAFNENLSLKEFNSKIKNTLLFKLYVKIKNKL